MRQPTGSPVDSWNKVSLVDVAERSARREVGWHEKLTYAGVDELEIFRSETDIIARGIKDELPEVMIGNVVEPFVEVCAALCVE